MGMSRGPLPKNLTQLYDFRYPIYIGVQLPTWQVGGVGGGRGGGGEKTVTLLPEKNNTMPQSVGVV